MASASWKNELRGLWKDAVDRGLPMPPEERLVAELGVSKPAVREALIKLEAEGLVARRVGIGTFPNPMATQMPARLDREVDFADMLRNAGFEPKLDVLEAGWVCLDEQDAKRLDCSPGTRGYRTRKRWFADSVPVMVAVDVVPVLRGDPDAPDPSTTIVELAQLLGVGKAEWILTWPSAANSDEEIAELLHLTEGDAVLTLEHIAVNRLGGRCFSAVEHHRPGYLRYGMILTV